MGKTGTVVGLAESSVSTAANCCQRCTILQQKAIDLSIDDTVLAPTSHDEQLALPVAPPKDEVGIGEQREDAPVCLPNRVVRRCPALQPASPEAIRASGNPIVPRSGSETPLGSPIAARLGSAASPAHETTGDSTLRQRRGGQTTIVPRLTDRRIAKRGLVDLRTLPETRTALRLTFRAMQQTAIARRPICWPIRGPRATVDPALLGYRQLQRGSIGRSRDGADPNRVCRVLRTLSRTAIEGRLAR